jgi:hypothetical protein
MCSRSTSTSNCGTSDVRPARPLVQPSPNDPDFSVQHSAWLVDTNDAGDLIVHLDQNVNGSHPEPAGEAVYPRGARFTVHPNF